MTTYRHEQNRVRAFVLILLAVLMTAACATQAPVSVSDGRSDIYIGAGRGDSLGTAINAAKMDAVREAVIDLIGADAAEANAGVLEEVLYSTRTPNAFVYNETMETLRRDGSLIDGDLYYEISIRVNVQAVQATLEANDIPRTGAGQSAADSRSTAGSATATPESSQTETRTQPAAVSETPVTEREQRFIDRFVDTMTFMVYFSDRSIERAQDQFADPEFLLATAVTQANSYLVEEGRVVIDAGQVDRLREDERLIYEEQAGEGVSLLQWIARRLNADVYIEIDTEVSARARSGNFYGAADVTLNMYETSTAQLLGSVVRQSPETFSRVSSEDAVQNAVSSTVYQAMPVAVSMAEEQMQRMAARGIRYELTLQGAPDARTLSRFRSELDGSSKGAATVSSAPGEARYEIFLVGSTDDLIALVFQVADRVAGLENIDLVVSRGRSVTFDAGL